ncbi:hypothetical protein ES319_D01G068500v1 [Gossypium barbadense]|uniref:Uncharacterized protein n=1 Tax=Gossypium barbadense TaxID=3634 RepID=A0A5J5SKL0_GOSBA|nr:hypothetical protein ES319_D01G068500v1 [Gossypium barbadense]
MEIRSNSFFIILIIFVSTAIQAKAYSVFCSNPASRCYGKYIQCPYEQALAMKTKRLKFAIVSYTCQNRKPNCNSPGSACYDPRFIGGDGIVFYFHGKSNEHFSLLSDTSLQINGRFISHRPAGQTQDFTWIQALGILFNSHSISLEATKAATWNSEVDHLKFSYNGEELVVPEGALSSWYSPEKEVKVKRDTAEIMVNIVPVTKEDDRVHHYKVPSDDCFAHLEVQFRFFSLSPNVDGALGRTYMPDFENPAKPDKYRTTSLLSLDYSTCLFSPETGSNQETTSQAEILTLDCSRGASAGYDIICKK